MLGLIFLLFPCCVQHSESLRSVQQLMNKLDIARSETDKDLSRLDNKIDKELANLLAKYERYRNDVMKYAGGGYRIKTRITKV